jgi:TRAP-type C4-dicarboxylate transport system substrate-binding protein
MDMEFFYKYGFLKYMRDIHAEQNVYYLAPANMGAVGLIGSFPFRKLEDMKGKKVWCIGSVAAFVKNLGGVPVTFPLSELYMALKLGTVEGAIPGFGDLDSAGYKDVIKYINYPPFLDPNASILIGMDSWKKLSPDVQKAVEDAIMAVHPSMYKCIDDYTVNAIDASKKKGVQIVTMEPKEVQRLRPAALQVWGEIAKRSPRAPKTVQMLKDFLKSKGVKLE